MARQARCNLDGGQLDPQAQDAIDRFAEWLRRAGPTGGPVTAEQREFRMAAMVDPEWRDWLGLPPLAVLPAEEHPRWCKCSRVCGGDQ